VTYLTSDAQVLSQILLVAWILMLVAHTASSAAGQVTLTFVSVREFVLANVARVSSASCH
jgi:hypothetical protein